MAIETTTVAVCDGCGQPVDLTVPHLPRIVDETNEPVVRLHLHSYECLGRYASERHATVGDASRVELVLQVEQARQNLADTHAAIAALSGAVAEASGLVEANPSDDELRARVERQTHEVAQHEASVSVHEVGVAIAEARLASFESGVA